ETVDPAGSRLVMVHEYDATPEDLPAGLALSLLTQVHDRYAQYYQGGMPWELLFADLGNGAQLMLAVLAFHDTPQGAATPVAGPPFDVGFSPQFGVDEPAQDDRGNAQIQRVPFAVSGAYAGCPVHGFAWSELIVNWYGHESDDPWYTGGAPPKTPPRCAGRPVPPPPPPSTGQPPPAAGI